MSLSATSTLNFGVDMALENDSKSVTYSTTLESMRKTFDRTLFIPTGVFRGLVDFGTPQDGETLTDFDFLYIENLDKVNFCTVAFFITSANEYISFRIPPGKFMVMFSNLIHGAGSEIVQPCTVPSVAMEEVQAQFDTHDGVIRVVAYEA